MNLTIPDLSLVVLIGASGSGKSTFARAHFRPTEVLSSDACRGLVSDDENDQAATKDAFEVLHVIAGKRWSSWRRCRRRSASAWPPSSTACPPTSSSTAAGWSSPTPA